MSPTIKPQQTHGSQTAVVTARPPGPAPVTVTPAPKGRASPMSSLSTCLYVGQKLRLCADIRFSPETDSDSNLEQP